MSFLIDKPPVNLRDQTDLALLHRLQCRACPLDKTVGGKMKPTGADKPLVYCMGEAPGKLEVEEQEQFIGQSGQVLRANIPREFKNRVRFNNVARSRPPSNATPDKTIIECCRPSVVADVEQSKPRAIFGFGNVPLSWVAPGFSSVTLWRGRKMPVKVGNHVCWYYPMLHPAFILRQGGRGGLSEEERMFRFDMERAFAEVEFLPPPVVHSAADARRGVEIITDDVDAVAEALSWASEQRIVGVDYETNGLRPYFKGSKILTIAIGTEERASAFAYDHSEAVWKPSERTEIKRLWCKFLKTENIKAVHNLAFEHEWTAEHFGPEYIRTPGWEDTATQAAVLDERKGGFSLEFLIQQYFGFNLKNLSNVNRKDLDNAPLEVVLIYNGMDSRYHCELWHKQDERLAAEGLQDAYELSLRTVPTVVLTQRKGVLIDQKEVVRLQSKYDKLIKQTEAKIAALPVIQEFKRKRGAAFNPLSTTDDLLFVLKDLLKLGSKIMVEDKYTKKRKYSTEKDILEKIDHPLAALIVSLREYVKRKSTYIDPMSTDSKNSVVFPDGLVHTQFNTFFAATGRLSSDTPNLQNIPKRDSEAKEVRKQFIAPPKHLIVAADFGQLEARLIAMFTKDKVFCKALWERYDVHLEWAERIAQAYPARVGGTKMLSDKKAMKDFRTDVKNQFTFPLFFGAKLESAAGYLHVPSDVLAPLYKEFWRQFSGVKKWQEELLSFYQEHGYIECLTGHRRRGPLSLNQVINSPVQGTAAQLVRDAMARLSEIGDPELQPEINIHDDLTWTRVREDKVDVLAEKALDIMLFPDFEWAKVVPMTVELSVGKNWLEMEDAGTFSSDEWK